MGSKVPQAVELLENAVKRDPNLSWHTVINEVILSLLDPGKSGPTWRTRAEAALRTASVSHLTSEKLTWPARCFYYYSSSDYDHALEELEVAARLLPNNAQVVDISARSSGDLGAGKRRCAICKSKRA